jgi:hypothetical protein
MIRKDPAETMAAATWEKVLGWLGVATIVAFALVLPAIAAAGR